jgi:hypothetical protein
MSALNLKDLSPEQEKIVQKIWSICEYLEASRTWNIEDSLIKEQARSIAFAMIDFRKEENKKNNSAVPA